MSVTFFRDAVPRRLCVILLAVVACDPTYRSGDTLGTQGLARWEWHARLAVEPDPRLTLTRLRIDTVAPGGPGGGGDVVLARYDFNPAEGEGDEYSITLGLELGRARDLTPGTPYPLGPPRIPAVATVTCLCRPLRPDSVRGTLQLATRGLRHLAGRVDATLFFTEWNDSTRHVTYSLHQRIDAIK